MEIGLRKQLKYPPFCDIMVIGISGQKEKNVIDISEKLHKYLKERIINEKIWKSKLW